MYRVTDRSEAGKQRGHFSVADIFHSSDRRAVMWSQEASGRPLVTAAWLPWPNIIAEPPGGTSCVSETRVWENPLTRGSQAYETVAHPAKWRPFSWGGDVSENSVNACCLAALNDHIFRCRAMSVIRCSLTGARTGTPGTAQGPAGSRLQDVNATRGICANSAPGGLRWPRGCCRMRLAERSLQRFNWHFIGSLGRLWFVNDSYHQWAEPMLLLTIEHNFSINLD